MVVYGFWTGAVPNKYLKVLSLDALERDLKRSEPFFPKEDREGKEPRRVRPQGPGGLTLDLVELSLGVL